MLRADVLVAEPLGFFRSIGQHALALVAQRKVHRRGNFLAHCGVRFDLLANRFDCGMRPQKPVCERFILSKQAQQQVLGFDIRTSELARLVSCEKDYAARFFGITFKHKCHRQDGLRLVQLRQVCIRKRRRRQAALL